MHVSLLWTLSNGDESINFTRISLRLKPYIWAKKRRIEAQAADTIMLPPLFPLIGFPPLSHPSIPFQKDRLVHRIFPHFFHFISFNVLYTSKLNQSKASHSQNPLHIHALRIPLCCSYKERVMNISGRPFECPA